MRRLALEVFLESAATQAFVDEVLARRLDELEGRDRQLAQEIVYGTVRHQNTLDRLLKIHLRVPVAKQRPPVRWALRLGVYQLVYLGRIPAHAAVHQTLEGLKRIEGVDRRQVGFVNAVLHKIVDDVRRKSAEPAVENDDPSVLPIRRGYCHFNRPVLPSYRTEPLDHLACKYSHPRWLLERWSAHLGEEETRRLLEANNRAPSATVRLTRLAPSLAAVVESLEEDGFHVEDLGVRSALRLGRGGRLSASAAWRKGWIQPQDLTAMEIGAALKPPSGARVLDLCSSPGGKATQLLEAVGEKGHLVAADQSEAKLAPVRENLERLGGSFSLQVVSKDPDAISLGESFTHVLLDAPCSNTGVLARRPEARWRLRPGDLERLTRRQAKLLEAAYRHLAPGGRLLYATCSIEPDENEERVAALVADHPDLTELESKLFLPHRVDGDGGFYSLLRRGSGG